MRPIRLKIKGINSFQEEQLIDFETLTQAGIFGIFGPTGSGKSTILDGITLALYGKLSRNSTNYINVNEEKASVVYEFVIAGAEEKTYQVSREFKRNKNDGINQGKCQLLELKPEGSVVLGDKTTEVTNACEDIIGLGLTDFTRTVVLPQGKFSDFLKLEGKPRRDMLERLFNLSKYGDDLTNRLKTEKTRETEKLNQIVGSMMTYEGVTPEALKEEQICYDENHQQLNDSQEKFKKLTSQLSEAEALMGLLSELKTARDEARNLDLKQTAISDKENQVMLGKKALEVAPFMEAFETLKDQIDESKGRLISSEEKLNALLDEKERCEKNFAKIDGYKNENLFKFQSKLEKVEDAIGLKEAQQVLDKDISDLNQQMTDANQRRVQLENEKTRLLEDLEKEKKQIDTDRRDEKKCRVEPDYRVKISHGASLAERTENLKEEIKSNRERLDKNTREIGKLLELEKGLEKQRRITESDQLDSVRKLATHKKAQPGTWDSIRNEKTEVMHIQNLFLKQTGIKANIEAVSGQISELDQTIENKKNLETLLKEEVETLKKEITRLENINLGSKLREQLRSGEPCPVCGSRAHPMAGHFEESDDSIKLTDLKEARQEKEKVLEKLTTQIAQLTGSLNTLRDNQKNLESELSGLGETIPDGQPEAMEKANTHLSQTMETWEIILKNLESQNNEIKQRLLMIDGEQKGKTATKKALTQQTDELAERTKTKEMAFTEQSAKLTELRAALKVSVSFSFHSENEKITKMDEHRNQLMADLEILEELFKNNQEKLEKLNETINGTTSQIQEKLILIGEKARQYLEKKAAIAEKVGSDHSLEELRELNRKFLGNIRWIEKNWISEKQKMEKSQAEYGEIQEAVTFKKANLDALKNQFSKAEAGLTRQLEISGFSDREAVKNAGVSDAIIKQLEEEIAAFYQIRGKINGRLEDLNQKIKGRQMTESAYGDIIAAHQALQESIEYHKTLKIQLKARIGDLEKRLAELAQYSAEKEKVDHRLALISDLEKLFSGKKFVEFVAVSRLKYISIEASKRLTEISNGNYGLEADDEGKFIIRDYKNGGAARDASTLSGGETFLASLALALALSAEIQLKGKAPLEFFFLDEGFGSLHEDALEVVMNSIERLHNDKLKVGIISHVESIKNRMPVKLLITPGEAGVGGSRVRIER